MKNTNPVIKISEHHDGNNFYIISTVDEFYKDIEIAYNNVKKEQEKEIDWNIDCITNIKKGFLKKRYYTRTEALRELDKKDPDTKESVLQTITKKYLNDSHTLNFLLGCLEKEYEKHTPFCVFIADNTEDIKNHSDSINCFCIEKCHYDIVRRWR